MRCLPMAFALLAACGGSNSSNNGDANGGGDGNGGDSLGGNPTTVTVTLTNHPDNAGTYTFLAAYQDGAAAWQLAPAPAGDTYSFTINSSVWGFAWTCIVPTTTIARVELAYFTVAEKTSLTETIPNACTDRVMNVGLSGNVANLDNGGNGFRDAFGTSGRAVMTSGNFGVETPAGTHDLFIVHATGTGGFGPVDGTTRQSATAPMTGVAVDWNNSAATVQTPVTITGGGVTTTLYTANGTSLNLGTSGGNGGGGTVVVTGLDASQQTAGDLYAMAATWRAQGSSETVEVWAGSAGAQTFTDPSPLGGAISSVTSPTPYPEITTTWNAYANSVGYIWDARQGGATLVPTLEWTAIVGPGYVGSTPKFQMPDLSALSGWATGFQMQTGQQVTGSSSALTSTAGATDFPTVNPAASGTQRVLVASGWTVTP